MVTRDLSWKKHPIPRAQPKGEVWFSAINPWWPWYKCYISWTWLVDSPTRTTSIATSRSNKDTFCWKRASLSLVCAWLKSTGILNELGRATTQVNLTATQAEATGQLCNNWASPLDSFEKWKTPTVRSPASYLRLDTARCQLHTLYVHVAVWLDRAASHWVLISAHASCTYVNDGLLTLLWLCVCMSKLYFSLVAM